MPFNKFSIFISHPSPFLTDNQPHGDGLIAFAFIKRLAARGHRIHVASPLWNLKEELPNNVTIHPIRTWFPSSPAAQSTFFRLEYAIRVRILYASLRVHETFDVIHQLNPVVIGLSLFLTKVGRPIVMGPYWPSWKTMENRRGLALRRRQVRSRVRLWLLYRQFRHCAAVLSPTAASLAELAKAGLSSCLAIPLNIGIDCTEFRPEPNSAPREPTILFLANLEKRKGIYTLLSAFETLSHNYPEARLLIGGSGSEQQEIQRRICAMGACDRISLLGRVPRERVREVMQRCSVYCLPSFGEPFGMSALEAMACGKPLVVTNAGGLGDLVRPEGGIKVSPGDSKALAEALEFLLRRPALQETMGRFNRNLAVGSYCWDRVIEDLELVYARVISSYSISASDCETQRLANASKLL